MSAFDVDQLVAPISDEAPSGENLEYEPEFGEFERAGEATPDQQMGDEVVEGHGADWAAVIEQGTALLERTHDLRVAVLMTRAAMNLHGPAGLANGIALVRSFLETHWGSVHPQLDAEDDDDPTFRVNSMLPLADRDGMLQDLGLMPLVSSKVVGRFGLRDTRVAAGELSPAEGQEQVPDTALISAAFQDSDLDELQADAGMIDQALEDIGKCEAIFAEQIGAANSPDMDQLVSELKDIQKIYAENLAARGIGVAIPDEEGGEAGGTEAGGAAISGDVRSREDAIRMIEKICAYYDRHEPSSPVPVLLQRVKRLVSMDYLEIVKELTPDAIAAVEALAGIQSEDSGY
ncbi:MAG: type VI secretion system protein TssA [Woeseiaceae bacterium]|nr:type VI secretion system protein TssA [Woeseiaceae bacterium]